MKTAFAILVALCVSTYSTNAQTASSSSPTAGTTGQGTPYAVVSKGANEQVWQKTTYETLPSGQTVPHIHQYTELATGLNFWNSTIGQWMESKEEIDVLPNGTAAATNGQHQVYFPGDIYEGVIELLTPDGKQLQSQPTGLSYDDGTNTVLIAELTNSVGYLVGSNQVLYPNAFTDFKADLLYTYTKAGFEQDIILRESPLAPESYGLNPSTARLQVLTEFFNPPQPAVTTTMLPAQTGIALADQNLDFGVMKMTPGRAFLLGSDANEPGVLVSKSWVVLEGRQFLVEEVPVEALADELAQLPAPQTASIKPNVNSLLHVVSAKRLLPAPRLTKGSPTGQFKQEAQAATPTRGLVLDYVTLNSSQTNYTFRGDSTYYVSGQLDLWGTNTFEGGAVIKYTNNVIMYFVAVNSLATAYRPTILTAKDDNSVGDFINGSTGNPTNYYATDALYLTSTNNSLQNMRIAFAQVAIGAYNTLNLNNVQMINCQNGVMLYGSYEPLNLNMRNVLMAYVRTNVNLVQLYDANAAISAENVTFANTPAPGDYNYSLVGQGSFTSWAASFTNCILANMTFGSLSSRLSGSYNGFSPAYPVFGSSSFTAANSPFQSAGGGNCYLTNGCPFLNVGTTNIDSNLLAELATRTTYPPIVYSNTTISVNTAFSPQAQRDTSSSPNLGYHYDPIDYAFGGVYVTNATVTINPGTAIATFGFTNVAYGLGIGSGAQLNCQGWANSLNQIVQYNTVQEQAMTNWSRVSFGSVVSEFLGISPAATINCSFTDWSMPAQDAPHLNGTNGMCNPISLQECQFYGGTLVSTYPTINLTNCLFQRVNASLWSADTNVPSVRNNLFWRGTFNFAPNVTNALVKDNLFDQTSISNNTGTTATYNGGFNAFVTNYNRLQPTFINDVILTNSLAYLSSWLGNYYQPTNSPLINAGSTNANLVGMYHYTVTTNQVIESNNIVSIGYHYVAVGTNGIPLSTPGDGIPDYLADANGNGLVDPGEISWTNYTSLYGLTFANGLLVFTPLK